MPNNKIHYKLWRMGWFDAIIASMLFAFYQPISSFGILIGYWIGQFNDPDLDLIGITGAEGRALRRFKILGALWVAYWIVYGFIFKKHRSFWTHSYVLSTTIRFIYAFWIIWLLIFKYNFYNFWMLEIFFGMFVGLIISDSIHILADRRIKNG